MTMSETPKGPLRYRLYYGLMNFAFVVIVLTLCLAIAGTAFGIEVSDIPPVIYYLPPILIWPVTYGIVPFLIVLSSMRDEYAEILWKRSIAQLIVLTTVLPPLVFTTVWFISIVILEGDVSNWNGHRPDWLLDPMIEEQYRLGTVIEFWQMFTFAFVILFQFNRWRDSG